MKNHPLIFFILLFFRFNPLSAQTYTINNAEPRFTNDGKIVDAHDGRVIQFGNKFYWYGTQYGKTNGFTNANKYVSYSSKNLTNWTFEGELIQNRPDGVYYRPHVVFNKKRKKYILWYNWNPKLWDGQFGVAESDLPTGPFKILNDNVKVKHSALGVGDLGVFIDDDDKAYLSYNTIQGHKLSVELLDENYTASTMQGTPFIVENCEAGSMFKRKGLYYLMTDYTCCFCTQGSGAMVYTANTPLGPFTHRQNINRHPGVASPVLNDGKVNDNFFEVMQKKQKNALETWFEINSMVSRIQINQFTGNRNGQCGEVNNPILHDPVLQYDFEVEYWKGGEWQKLNAKKSLKTVSQQNIYQIDFALVNTDRIKITPVYKDSTTILNLFEVKFNTQNPYTIYKTNGNDGKPIIPGQQTFVMELNTQQGIKYIWMGDLWGSSSENIKGNDYQFWSEPLTFYENGLIKPIKWVDKWQVK
jgi:Glycosyl hydrolases family 43